MSLLSRLRRSTPLPASFRFGVAISDHQSEAFDDCFPPDIWDSWERHHAGVVPRGRATDFWHRWEEDVLNAHQLGCRAFRFSIAWTRVEPRAGEFDQSVLAHYRAMVLRLRDLDMEPIVTLCHFVWPQHVEDRGGLRSDQFAKWFAAYAAQVRAALDPHVRYWITFNEPNIVLQGFYRLWFQPDYGFPPGDEHGSTPASDEIDSTITVIRHLFEAHTTARRALRSEQGEHNLVSANVFQLGLPPFVQRLIDWNVKRLKNEEDWRNHLWRVVKRPALLSRFRSVALPAPDTIFTRLRNLIEKWLQAWTVFSTFVASSWWYLGMRGELPNDLCPDENAGQFDFVSFDYYFGVSALTPDQLYRLALSMQRQFHQAALWPGGLYQALRYYHRLFPDKPIVIAENGFADGPNGQRRGEQLAAHVKSVQRAIGDGIDVQAYCVWSITSNREWGLPQTSASDFGLYYVDMEQDRDLKRRPTPSAEAYRKLIEQLKSDQ